MLLRETYIGASKLAIGVGLGTVGDNLTSFLGENGVSSALTGFMEGALKIFNEMNNAIVESIGESKTKEQK